MAERSSSRQPGSPTDPLSNISAFRRDPAIGSMLGKYQITGLLGQGGMGIVYQGLDTVLHRKVAIKVLPDTVAGDDNALQRFLREARTAARLTHPNVVAVFDVNQQDGLHYLVMELVTGRSLAAQLEEQGPLDWREATRVIADACRGLSAAHAASLIHRDIKPGNLLRSGDGLVKLADFGLAKATDRTALTQSGSVLGTPLFMSPEQCQSRPLDPRSDIYSLGATYYMLLTGEPPYRADGSIEVMFAHCHNPVPDPRQHQPDLPASCAAIVKKAMAKEPGQRFQTAAEMLAALDAAAVGQYLADTSVLTAPIPSTNRRRLVLVGLLGLGGIGLIGLVSYLTSSAGQPTKALALPPTKDGSAAGKRALMILASKGFHDPDYTPVRRVLEQGGVKVTVASTRSPAMPDFGGGQSVVPDLLLDAVRVSDYDAIIFCGGNGVQEFTGGTLPAKQARGLIEQAMAEKKLVTALCFGPVVLADAGVLRGKRATVFKRDVAPIINAGAEWLNEPVVVSGNIITGRDPQSAEQFARTVLDALRR